MKIDKKSQRQCIYCHNFCKFSCVPHIATKNQKIIQTQRNYLIYMAEKNKIEPNHDLGKAVFMCNDCRRCETYCVFDNKKVTTNNRYAKNFIFDKELAPEKVYEIYDNFIKTGNFLGKKIRQYTAACYTPDKTYDFFIYFGDYVNLLTPRIKDSFIKILRHLNKDFAFTDPECTDGVLALDLGMEELALKLMDRNFKNINRYKFKTLICIDPYSCNSFKTDYPEHGYKFDSEILHYTEFLDKFIKEAKINKTKEPVKYFDPCMLSRALKINDSPRNILGYINHDNDFDLIKNRKESECCGGNLSIIFPDIAQTISSGFLKDLENYDDKTEMLITACPLCLNNLSAVQQSRFKIYDIAEYVYKNIDKAN